MSGCSSPTVETVDPVSPHKDPTVEDIGNNEIPKDVPDPSQSVPGPEGKPDPLPAYIWSQAGHTACSTTCGTGKGISRTPSPPGE